VSNAFIDDLDDLRILALERYDPDRGEDGLKRVHQENFCQAMGLLPEYKYEHEGGPGFVQCIELLRGVSAKAWDSPRAGKVPFLLLFPFKLAHSILSPEFSKAPDLGREPSISAIRFQTIKNLPSNSSFLATIRKARDG